MHIAMGSLGVSIALSIMAFMAACTCSIFSPSAISEPPRGLSNRFVRASYTCRNGWIIHRIPRESPGNTEGISGRSLPNPRVAMAL